ncbi:MAG: lipid-A-disaccharide synthase [Cyclobacteriaceae bacterium]
MKYFLIAGERSGDLHGSYLVKAIRQQDPAAEFVGYGGDLMQKQGMRLLSHYQEAAFMGIFEVVKNLRLILFRILACKNQIDSFSPDAVVLIDYPGFNLRMAAYAKSKGIRTFYYISPKIWAWKEGRIKKIRKYVDRMLVVFPFEVPYYKQLEYPVTYVGNPLVEQIDTYKATGVKGIDQNADYRITFMPGSRKQEVLSSLPRIKELALLRPTWQLLVTAVDNLPAELYSSLAELRNVLVVTGGTYDVLLKSDAAVVTSGTATLETALLGIPQVVCYEAHPISYAIGKRLIKVKYISLVNLIADEAIVKELIQDEYNPDSLTSELDKLLLDKKYRNKIQQNYSRITKILETKKASQEASMIIFNDLRI